MILLDSSGWIEIITNSKLAPQFEKQLKSGWIVSPINLFEIYRKIAKESEEAALQAIATIQEGTIIPVDETLSLEASDLSLKYKLGMADSLILATAYQCEVKLVTKDNDFRNIPECIVISS